MDPAGVLTTQVLLVDGGFGQGQLACFFEKVDAVLPCFFGLLLCVKKFTGCVELDVHGQNCLRPLDEEERSVAGGPVWRGAKAPKHSR